MGFRGPLEGAKELTVGNENFCPPGPRSNVRGGLCEDVALAQEITTAGMPYIISPRGYVTASRFNERGVAIDEPKLLLQWRGVSNAKEYHLELIAKGWVSDKYVVPGTETQAEYPFPKNEDMESGNDALEADMALENGNKYVLRVTAVIDGVTESEYPSSIPQKVRLLGDEKDYLHLYFRRSNTQSFGFVYHKQSSSPEYFPKQDFRDQEFSPEELEFRDTISEAERNDEDNLFRAMQYFQGGYFSQSLQTLKQITRQDEYLDYLRGVSASKIGLLKDAKGYYRQVNRTNNTYAHVSLYAHLGLLFLEVIEHSEDNQGNRLLPSYIKNDLLSKLENEIIPLYEEVEIELTSFDFAKITWEIGKLYNHLDRQGEAESYFTSAKDAFQEIKKELDSLEIDAESREYQEMRSILNCLDADILELE